jgi:hypothetical protein
MVFAGSGITYSELKEMDLREYREAVEARLLWQGGMEPQQKEIAVPSGGGYFGI